MMSASESLEEEASRSPQNIGESMAQSLELLDGEQTMRLVRVIAEDMRIKCDLYSLVRESERSYAEIELRFQPRQDVCSFCHQPFGRLKKSQQCEKCDRYLCKNCIHSNKCQCCLALERLTYKREEFRVLCPLPSHQFGTAKYKALAVERIRHEDWQLFAQLELHFQYALKHQLDQAEINFRVNDPTLENARQQLVVALMSFNQDSHFAFLNSATSDIEKILQTQSSWLQEDSAQSERLGYFHLLSNAVLWVLKETRKEPVRSRADLSSLSSHKSFFPELSDQDREQLEATNSLYGSDSETPTLVQNWFTKPKFASPRGSIRSQSASHIVNSITTPQFFRYGSENNLHYINNSISAFVSDEETPKAVSLNGSLHSVSSMKDDETDSDSPRNSITYTNLNIKMDRQLIEAIDGQFVQIGCQLMTNDPTVEVLWYNRYRQIKDSARILIRNYTSESILEIFDCSIGTDSGDIICLAIGETGIVSDVCRLSIKDEDIAGEEPFFTQSLTVSTSRPKEGTAFYLECKCVGYPLPYVSFFHNNKRIQHEEKSRISHNDGCWTLRITNANLTHNGNYTAVATNRCGRCYSRTEVNVQNIEKDESTTKTEILVHAVNLTMTEETIELEANRPQIIKEA